MHTHGGYISIECVTHTQACMDECVCERERVSESVFAVVFHTTKFKRCERCESEWSGIAGDLSPVIFFLTLITIHPTYSSSNNDENINKIATKKLEAF